MWKQLSNGVDAAGSTALWQSPYIWAVSSACCQQFGFFQTQAPCGAGAIQRSEALAPLTPENKMIAFRELGENWIACLLQHTR